MKNKILKLSDNKKKAIKQINSIIRMPYGDKSTPYTGKKRPNPLKVNEIK